MQRRAVPDDAVRRTRLRGRALRASTSGTAWRSPPGSASRTWQIGFDGQPTWSDKPDVEAAAEARALGATCGGVRVWSLYVPNGRTVDSPHYRYKLEWLAALRKTSNGWLTEDPARADRAGRRLEHRAHRRGRVEMSSSLATAPTSPHPSARRSTRSSTPDSPTWYGRSPRAPASTPTGTTPSCGSRSGRACASTSSSAHRRWPSGWPTPRSSATNAKGKGASDHAPVLVELTG